MFPNSYNNNNYYYLGFWKTSWTTLWTTDHIFPRTKVQQRNGGAGWNTYSFHSNSVGSLVVVVVGRVDCVDSVYWSRNWMLAAAVVGGADW